MYNLVRNEESLPHEEKLRTVIRSVILMESLKRTNYFADSNSMPNDALNG